MSSRRREGANAGNSSPMVTRTYDLRGRTKRVVQQSSVRSTKTSAVASQTPEPGSQDDISGFVRPIIKSAGKDTKVRTVEKTVISKSTKRHPTPAKADIDSDSDGSDYSSSSRVLPESDRQSRVILTSSSRTGSAKRQPTPRRELDQHSDDETQSSLFRPPIHLPGGSAKKQPPQARQLLDYTIDDKTKYYKDEPQRGRTKTRQSQSSSEEEASQEQQKPTGPLKSERLVPSAQLYETRRYKEQRETWRSPNFSDRGEDPIVFHRYQAKPKEIAKTQPAQCRPRGDFSNEATKTQLGLALSHIGFSDDDEERETRYQHKTAPARLAEADKRNHYPDKAVGHKASFGKKRSPRSFLRFAGSCMKYFLPVLLVVLAGSVAVFYISPESVYKMTGQLLFADKPQIKKDLRGDFEKLSSIFPDQSPLMWNRSRRILELHLEKWKRNTEPAIILLTGAHGAEQTLLCLGTRLADIYSSSLNGSYKVISGSDWVSGSSEKVKEHIDDGLSSGFQATTQAAVLHRLELLPAGSLLILYKYCDHESAVFKDVLLLLTVLLEDDALAKGMPLTDLEEKVREFLIQKLIHSSSKASHDGMDRDKFSGVWSRISHVVLPVFPENHIAEKCAKKPNESVETAV